MPNPSSQQLLIALTNDLNKSGSSHVMKFVDEEARKTFTANKDGVLFEFAHKQPDSSFWNGVKYYSSGKQSKIRIPRTQADPV
jgi:phosphoribosyl-ATP pyrophosphohydrolase